MKGFLLSKHSDASPSIWCISWWYRESACYYQVRLLVSTRVSHRWWRVSRSRRCSSCRTLRGFVWRSWWWRATSWRCRWTRHSTSGASCRRVRRGRNRLSWSSRSVCVYVCLYTSGASYRPARCGCNHPLWSFMVSVCVFVYVCLYTSGTSCRPARHSHNRPSLSSRSACLNIYMCVCVYVCVYRHLGHPVNCEM